MTDQLVNTGSVTIPQSGTVVDIQNWEVAATVTRTSRKSENHKYHRKGAVVGIEWTWNAEGQDGTLPTLTGAVGTLTLNGQDASGNNHVLTCPNACVDEVRVRTAVDGPGGFTVSGRAFSADGSASPWTTTTGF